MADTGSVLQFERADYAEAQPEASPCALCRHPLGEEYWKWQRAVFCTACRPNWAAKLAETQSLRTTVRAGLAGAGAALLCGVGYAVFVAVTNFQLALVTIGIAYVIGRAIRKASGNVGGLRFQILAVVLTYVASTMGYAPGLMRALSEQMEERPVAAAVSAREASSATPQNAQDQSSAAPTTPTPVPHSGGRAKPPLGALLYLCFVLFTIMLEAPFLELSTAPLGVVIIGIGLWQAWKITRGVPLQINGPYRLTPAPAALERASDPPTAS